MKSPNAPEEYAVDQHDRRRPAMFERGMDAILNIAEAQNQARAHVAVLRGSSLSQFEMQTYAKMREWIDLKAFHLSDNHFRTDFIAVPYRHVTSIDEPMARIRSKLGFYFNLLLQATCGLDYLHLGLVNKLKGFDIVHTMETFHSFSWQALQAKREHGCKLVTTVWENRPFVDERFKAKRDMKYAVLMEADLHIAVTERSRQCLLLEGADPEKVKVIPAGIDVGRFTPGGGDGGLRDRLRIAEDEFVILSVAALRWEKGVHDLVHAVKRLSDDPECSKRRIRLVLAGSGPEQMSLKRLAKRIGLQDMVTITRFDYEDLPTAYRAADVFVLASTARPGWLEQFAYVLPEALASGLPVIATRSGSTPEVLGDAGVVVPPSDFLGLSEAIKELMLDTGRREQLGVVGREFAEARYDSRLVARRIAAEYERLLEK